MRFISLCLIVMMGFMLLPVGASATDLITPDNDLTGYEFVPGLDYEISPRIDWTHVYDNYTPVEQQVSRTVSRTKHANYSTSVEVSVNGLFGMSAGIEVEIGESVTVSWTETYNCAPMGRTTCCSGSLRRRSTGTENYWFRGTLMTSDYVSTTYSVSSYTAAYYDAF